MCVCVCVWSVGFGERAGGKGVDDNFMQLHTATPITIKQI